jgi:hypothetical protein
MSNDFWKDYEPEPHKGLSEHLAQATNGRVYVDPVTGDVGIGTPAAFVQDSTCSETLRAQGKAYPRTCRKCGLGPCIGAPNQPPAAPNLQAELDATNRQVEILSDALAESRREVAALKAVQEPVRLQCVHCGTVYADGVPPAAQRQWVGLSDEELSIIYNQTDWNVNKDWNYERAIEAKLKEKNT